MKAIGAQVKAPETARNLPRSCQINSAVTIVKAKSTALATF